MISGFLLGKTVGDISRMEVVKDCLIRWNATTRSVVLTNKKKLKCRILIRVTTSCIVTYNF
jgi:hypothetical protein